MNLSVSRLSFCFIALALVAPALASPDLESPDRVSQVQAGLSGRWLIWETAKGRDILTSTDAGQHWRKASPENRGWTSAKVIRDYESDDGSAGYDLASRGEKNAWVALSTRQSGRRVILLERTDDAGASWEESTLSIPEELGGLVQLELGASGLAHLLVSGIPSGPVTPSAVFVTSNGGQAWEPVALPQTPEKPVEPGFSNGYSATAIAFRTHDDGWLCGTSNGPPVIPLFHTADGGETWTTPELDLPAPFTGSALGGQSGLPHFRPDDSMKGDLQLIVKAPRTGKAAKVYFTTSDAGATWQRTRTEPLTAEQMAQLQLLEGQRNGGQALTRVCDDQRQWAEWFSEGNTEVVRTSDAGKTWQTVTPARLRHAVHPVEDEGISSDLFALDENRAWVAYAEPAGERGGKVFTLSTSDGGNTWGVWSSFSAEQGVDGPMYLQFVDPQHGFLLAVSSTAGLGGRVEVNPFATTDGGRSWRPINWPTNHRPTGLAFRTPKEGWCTACYQAEPLVPLYRTTDGGQTWDAQIIPLPPAFHGRENYYGNTYPPRFFGLERREGELPVHLVSHEPAELVQDVNYVTHDGGATWLLPPARP